MAEEAIVKVKTLTRSEPIERKDGKGTYKRVTLETNEGTLGGFENNVPEDIQSGDTVKVRFQSNTRDIDGKKVVYKNLLGTVIKVEQQAINATIENLVENGIHSNSTGGSRKLFTKEKSTFDNKGARIGGVMHDAVALAIHNSPGSPVKTEQIKVLAQDLLKLASELEKT